ncbi:MAG: MFS transporter [Anaerolineae bacterium]|nr:MFS transporter [Anaerolineae bacterium]MCX8066532.1 MFS transporter [Anaerolineae bacterium]MDW7992885.1 MFS transporter [Anaerolineae bacterium]
MAQRSLPSNWATRFFTIWTGQAFSLFGSMLVQFALVWWLTKITGSATVLALATMVALLPQVFLGPFVGALVDRWNRRLVMMVTDSLIALTTLVLAALAAAGAMQVGHVFLVMFLRSVGGVFHWAAMQASTFIPSIVYMEDQMASAPAPEEPAGEIVLSPSVAGEGRGNPRPKREYFRYSDFYPAEAAE